MNKLDAAPDNLDQSANIVSELVGTLRFLLPECPDLAEHHKIVIRAAIEQAEPIR